MPAPVAGASLAAARHRWSRPVPSAHASRRQLSFRSGRGDPRRRRADRRAAAGRGRGAAAGRGSPRPTAPPRTASRPPRRRPPRSCGRRTTRRRGRARHRRACAGRGRPHPHGGRGGQDQGDREALAIVARAQENADETIREATEAALKTRSEADDKARELMREAREVSGDVRADGAELADHVRAARRVAAVATPSGCCDDVQGVHSTFLAPDRQGRSRADAPADTVARRSAGRRGRDGTEDDLDVPEFIPRGPTRCVAGDRSLSERDARVQFRRRPISS